MTDKYACHYYHYHFCKVEKGKCAQRYIYDIKKFLTSYTKNEYRNKIEKEFSGDGSNQRLRLIEDHGLFRFFKQDPKGDKMCFDEDNESMSNLDDILPTNKHLIYTSSFKIYDDCIAFVKTKGSPTISKLVDYISFLFEKIGIKDKLDVSHITFKRNIASSIAEYDFIASTKIAITSKQNLFSNIMQNMCFQGEKQGSPETYIDENIMKVNIELIPHKKSNIKQAVQKIVAQNTDLENIRFSAKSDIEDCLIDHCINNNCENIVDLIIDKKEEPFGRLIDSAKSGNDRLSDSIREFQNGKKRVLRFPRLESMVQLWLNANSADISSSHSICSEV